MYSLAPRTAKVVVAVVVEVPDLDLVSRSRRCRRCAGEEPAVAVVRITLIEVWA